jgi:hypothetical protein
VKDLQETVEKAIRDSLKDSEGAGSDLTVYEEYGVWLEVDGNLDVQHLASHLIEVIGADSRCDCHENRP